jgi:hypothetical protein
VAPTSEDVAVDLLQGHPVGEVPLEGGFRHDSMVGRI